MKRRISVFCHPDRAVAKTRRRGISAKRFSGVFEVPTDYRLRAARIAPLRVDSSASRNDTRGKRLIGANAEHSREHREALCRGHPFSAEPFVERPGTPYARLITPLTESLCSFVLKVMFRLGALRLQLPLLTVMLIVPLPATLTARNCHFEILIQTRSIRGDCAN
jgi:hypothetical protein